jgi:ABC-type phosphate/phosphonate transport system substrate-binding protein
MRAVLRVVSLLAANAQPLYERITRYLAGRLAAPVELVAGPLAERRRRLDTGDADLAFICGWPYALRHDRPEPQVELLCAPVMAGPRYGGRPVYFTDVIVRRDHPARSFTDLRGAVWAYNDTGSHSGYNVTRHHLLQLGETHGYFGRVVDAGTHQGSIQMVLDGTIDASGIDSTVLETELARRPGAPDARHVRAEPDPPGGRGAARRAVPQGSPAGPLPRDGRRLRRPRRPRAGPRRRLRPDAGRRLRPDPRDGPAGRGRRLRHPPVSRGVS